MRLVLVLCMYLICGQAALAAEWVPYSESNEGDKSYLDAESITVRGDKRIAWTKVEKAAPVAYEGGVLSSWMALIEVDCKAKTQRTISEVGYHPDGSMLYQFPEQNKASAVVPESVGEIRLEAMCKRTPRTRRRLEGK